MDYRDFCDLFCRSLTQNSLPIPDESAIKRFYGLVEHLFEVNSVTNLTAIRSIEDAIPKHLADSLLAAKHLPHGASVLDLGCGPGFPSLPLAIARLDLKLVALDSTAKKVAFVQETASLLGLENLRAVTGRAEDRSLMAELGKFDAVVSRAVAKMSVLAELCLPYVRTGGILLALKASKVNEELAEAKKAIPTLGGGAPSCHFCELTLLNGEKEQRCLVEVPKTKETPKQYPRQYAAILKKPL